LRSVIFHNRTRDLITTRVAKGTTKTLLSSVTTKLAATIILILVTTILINMVSFYCPILTKTETLEFRKNVVRIHDKNFHGVLSGESGDGRTDAGLLARSQYSEGPATGHLDTGFSWCSSVYKRMLRWFPSFQVTTTCLSCRHPDLNSLVTYLMFVYT
jgi:hypothetical protein